LGENEGLEAEGQEKVETLLLRLILSHSIQSVQQAKVLFFGVSCSEPQQRQREVM
jgi:hypothetical protein